MANIFRLQQTSPWTLEGVGTSIRAIARAVAAEHKLALRAATKAASPRQSLAEVRAMYVCHLSRTSTELNLAVRSANDA